MKPDSFIFTDIGGREENQDRAALAEKEDSGLYLIADGLGGHRNGRMAADCAAESILASWKNERPDTEEKEDEYQPAGTGRLTEWIREANEAILAMQKKENCQAKSTLAVLLLEENRAAWAHTGDSRIYRLHDGQIASVTEDHSVAFKKYKAGEIRKEDIPTDEDQASLLRSLGTEKRWEPAVDGTDELEAGDAFLLCSDGFWEYILDEEILVDSLKSETAKEWASLMLLRVTERIRPGNDNLSLITVMVKE
ncbi:MAG: serine/threonine-protein phosphatase [Oscillospiraceae bacterium]|nr:serine/threonine-protein phosphatase [Oscillospiraceae bacterium]